MNTIQEFTDFLLILIPIGVAARVVYCLLQLPLDEEQAPTYKRRIRNALVFLVLAECITGLLAVVQAYFIT